MTTVNNQSFRNISSQRTNFNVPVPKKPILKSRKRDEDIVLMPTSIQNIKANASKERTKSNLRTNIISDQSLDNATARDNSQNKIN